MRPNFLVIGAGRCGTTSLCAWLEQHPDVFVSNPKEPGFFTEFYHRGWGWYESLFRGAEGFRAVGEGSNNYSKCTVFPEAVARIAKDLPDARLIYIVRDPMKRIESDWRYSALTEREELPFIEAIRTRGAKYVDPSNYLMQLERYREHYPDERILVLFLEDMKQDPDGLLRRCFEFLGLDSEVDVADKAGRNAGFQSYRVRWWGRMLMRVPGMRAIRNILPGSGKNRLRSLFGRQVEVTVPRWSRPLFEDVRAELQVPSTTFLNRFDKDPRLWSFDAADFQFVPDDSTIERGAPGATA